MVAVCVLNGIVQICRFLSSKLMDELNTITQRINYLLRLDQMMVRKVLLHFCLSK